ncbi:GLPGLI family protein [Riemerella columbina]|uniref:GLPGLI family protein n=1 Tax=Riemerella columbina TaxID=103810 RepID=UPI00266F5025|nr:GLPGLI family protein [Riemerella columbina]WKS94982.1 GLPGLI family protein [Riemerella columbina]
MIKNTILKALSFVFIFLSLSFQAQDLMVYYNVSFKEDSLAEHLTKDEVVLDLSPKETKFYSSEYLKVDSIRRATNQTQFAQPEFNDKIKRQLNSHHNEAYYTISTDYYRLETDDVQNWTLHNDTKTVNGILLRKATTTFGKRNWEAWFAEEYPISEGPHNLEDCQG